MNTVQNTAPTANPLRLCLRYILKSANGSLHYISHAKACGDEILKAGGIPPKQANSKRAAAPATNTASHTRHHGSHGSAPKRNTYRERYTS